jgi:glycosyltransferase involved in cell wall biosynthesis
MRSIDIVYPGKLSSPIGPSQIIKRISSSVPFFRENNLDICVHSVDESSKEISVNLKQAVQKKWYISSFLYDVAYIFRLEVKRFLFIRRYVQKNRNVDVVVFDHVTSYLYYLFLNKGFLSKIVLFQHTNGRISDMGKARNAATARLPHVALIERLFNKNLHKLSKIIFISKNAYEVFVDENQNHMEKATYILNGIPDLHEPVTYHIPTHKIKLITVGTITKRKGADIIINALSKLSEDVKNKYELTIVGDGSDRIEFESLAEDLGLNSQVRFVGKKSQQDVKRLLSHSNVYVQMSLSEGLPLALLEAMRASLPIITTDVGGCSETVSNDNGYLLNPDPDELASCLSSLSAEKLLDMSYKSRELFEKEFNFDIFITKYKQILTEV